MQNQMQATLQGPDSYRTTARAVGVLFLVGMVAYGAGNILIQSLLGAPDYVSTVSANSMQVAICAISIAMLMLMASAFHAAHRGSDGVLGTRSLPHDMVRTPLRRMQHPLAGRSE